MQYGRYSFSILFQDDAALPEYKGSTFRGAFGQALKKVACALKLQNCAHCLLNQRCVYYLVFEQTPPGISGDGRKRIAAPPHPYVIELPEDFKTRFPAGEFFGFSLLLFGNANDYLPYFIYAFDQMGKTGIGRKTAGGKAKYLLKEVAAHDGIIYSSLTGKLRQGSFAHDLTLPYLSDGLENAVRQVRLTLQTPLRLKFDNHLHAALPFHVLIRAMLRRVSSLLQYHGEGEPALDYRGLVARAEAVAVEESSLRWFDWKRFSSRQDQSMLLGGMVGSVAYSGNLMLNLIRDEPAVLTVDLVAGKLIFRKRELDM
ncbi:MAG: hypothetical protein U1C55_04225, partial [Smithellaceae bacterium]|nr:hypothetical protein [Smithellaceae bacterium]